MLRPTGHRVETFDSAEALLGRISTDDRGCVLLDLQMPGKSGLELQQALFERGIGLPLIFISGRADVPAAVSAMKQGAVDFLSKPVDPQALLTAVERALRKGAERLANQQAHEEAVAKWRALATREQEVCRLSARGLINKQIAAALGSVESTVQAQRARAFRKLGITSVVELTPLLKRLDDK
jgi:FixJ family two-component response regulator